MNKQWQQYKWLFFCAALCIGLAAFFRFWHLAEVPLGLNLDEAANANDALEALRTGNRSVFYRDNYGREGLFISLVSIAFGWFGVGVVQLRIVSAMAGVLAVAGMYVFVREYTGRHATAMWAMLIMAVLSWSVHFTRIGLRVSVMLPVLVWFLAVVFYALRTKRLWAFVVAGVLGGIGMYTYLPFRIMPLFVAFIVVLYWIDEWKWGIASWKNAVAGIGTFGVTVLPLVLFFLVYPNDAVERTARLSIAGAESPFLLFLHNMWLQVKIFFSESDPSWVHGLVGEPLIDPLSQVLLLLGVNALVFMRFQLSVAKRVLLFAGVLIGMLPAALSAENLPHALRSTLALPFMVAIMAVGAQWVIDQIRQWNARIALVIALAVASSIVVIQYQRYFVEYGNARAVPYAYTHYHVEIAESIRASGEPTVILIDVPGLPMDGDVLATQALKFLLHDVPYVHYVMAEDYIAKEWEGTRVISLIHEEHLEQIAHWCILQFPEEQRDAQPWLPR